jgi:hypothetical protein
VVVKGGQSANKKEAHMSLVSIVTWLSAEEAKIQADIEAAFAKAAPVIEAAFSEAAKIEPYIAIFCPAIMAIPGIQPALAAMPSLIQAAQTACGPGTTGEQKLTGVLSLMQGVSAQAQTMTTGAAKVWTADETAKVTTVVNNAVSYMKAAGQIQTIVAAAATPAAASNVAASGNYGTGG